MLRALGPLALLFLAGAAAAAGPALVAEADRMTLHANEHLVLTLSLSGSDTRLRAEGVNPNVDLTVLADDFEIGTPKAEFRFNTHLARGRATSRLSVELFPRRTGRLMIPAFEVAGEQTSPITIEVRPAEADVPPEVFARSGAARTRLLVGEQTLLWHDLYYRVGLASARFGDGLTSRPARLEAHTLPDEERTETVDGVTYRVARTAWAVSPLIDGDVVLVLPDVWIETSQGRQWRLPFREERLQVAPLPEQAGTPLIGAPQLEVTLPGGLREGEPAPWRIELRSRTALSHLPTEPPLAEPERRGDVRSYMTATERRIEPDGDDVISVVTYEGHLLASRPGEVTSPALRIGFHDPAAGPGWLEEAGEPLHVEPAPAASHGPEATLVTPGAPSPGPADSEWRWRAIAAVLGLAWFTTLLAWLGHTLRRHASGRVRHLRTAPPDVGRAPLAVLLGLLGRARTLEEGLRRWERAHGSDPAVRAAIRRVQRARYDTRSAGTGHDDGQQANLQAALDEAILMVRDRPVPADAPETEDPWMPEAFRSWHEVDAGR